MEVRQAYAGEGQFIEIRCGNLASEGADVGITEVVGDDVENVGSPVSQGVHRDNDGLYGVLLGVLGTGGNCAGNAQDEKPGPGIHSCIPLNRYCSRHGT